MEQNNKPEPLTVTVQEGERIIGIGHTKMYELINSGKIKTIKIGQRRLIVYSSLKALVSIKEES